MNNKSEIIKSNWDKLNSIVRENFESEQSNNIRLLFEHFEDRIIEAPASGRPNYHNCFPGGWIDHTLRVIETSLKMREHFVDLGVDVTAKKEDVILAAMFHDLGKLGDLNDPYYKIQTDDWRRKKLKEFYTHNSDMENLSVTDRALWLLQHFGVTMTQNEFIGLRLTDGMYEDANKAYYVSYVPERQLRSNIAYILHQADMLATHVEYDEWKRGELEEEQKVQHSVDKIKEAATNDEISEQLSEKSKDLFEELFGEAS